MTVSIIRFGGSNCDRDALLALDAVDVDAEIVWHEDGLPEDTTGIVLPGGFSYGDYLRAGAMAAQSPVMDEVRELVEDGVPLLGVCNGAQIGCEAGLAPGAFTTNASARFQCEHVHLRVENADTPWTAAYEEGDVVTFPIAHGEGRYEVPDEQLATLEAADRVLFRYCDAEGNVTDEANPNGSKGNVAGVVSDDGRVALLMPHPERAALPEVGTAGSGGPGGQVTRRRSGGGADGRGMLRGFARR